jgi:hypothetical protein
VWEEVGGGGTAGYAQLAGTRPQRAPHRAAHLHIHIHTLNTLAHVARTTRAPSATPTTRDGGSRHLSRPSAATLGVTSADLKRSNWAGCGMPSLMRCRALPAAYRQYLTVDDGYAAAWWSLAAARSGRRRPPGIRTRSRCTTAGPSGTCATPAGTAACRTPGSRTGAATSLGATARRSAQDRQAGRRPRARMHSRPAENLLIESQEEVRSDLRSRKFAQIRSDR